MIVSLYMGYTGKNDNIWVPIIKMTWNNGKYYVTYLMGLLSLESTSADIDYFTKSKIAKVGKTYTYDEIPAIFNTRMIKKRTHPCFEYTKVFENVERLAQLGLSTDLDKFNAIEYIARNGGRRHNDSYDVFPEVTPNEFGIYHFYFLIGESSNSNVDKHIDALQVEDLLDVKNRSIYKEECLLDRVPGYINDIATYHPRAIQVVIAKINYTTFFNKNTILCIAKVNGNIYIPFSDSNYQPVLVSLNTGK